MPHIFPSGPESLVIYDSNDIQSFLKITSNPQAKYSLSKQGAFELEPVHSRKLELDFSKLQYFKFQGQTFEEWKNELPLIINPTPGGLLEAIIIEKILQRKLETYKMDGATIGLAQKHLRILQQAYQSSAFETPVIILQQIIFPLECLLKQVTLPPTTAPDTAPPRSINLDYDFDSEQWVVKISNKITIDDNISDGPVPVEYSITATLPLDAQTTKNVMGGFNLTQMTIKSNAHYVQAFDCFLHTNQDWGDEPCDLHALLLPLISYVGSSKTTTGPNQNQLDATTNLKQLLQASIQKTGTEIIFPPQIKLSPAEIMTLKQPGKLHNIVWNLGFLIAIKSPSLYRQLGIARPCLQLQ